MKILSTIFQFFPYILGGIIAVEQQIQAPGATKKQIILNSITAAAQVGEQVPNDLTAGISALIDETVGTLNKAGVFTSSTPAPVAAIVPPALPKS